MSLKFILAAGEEEITALAKLAFEIWHEYFIDIISVEQIEYMIDKFQSYDAIKAQIETKNYCYYLLELNGTFVGYTAFVLEADKLFLSKLYLVHQCRGIGLANLVFHFIENICVQNQLSAIWLTVNRYNEKAINVYRKKGFDVMKEQALDIGNGFFMDDYIMEKKLNI